MVSKNPDFKDSEGMVADTSNPDTQEAEVGYDKSEASLSYTVRACFKK